MKKIILVVLSLAVLFVSVGIGNTAMDEMGFIELCKNGTPQQVEAAIKGGADVNARDDDSYTPLMYAVDNPNPKVIALLLNAGADVNAEQEWGHWPLKVLTIAAMNPNSEVIALLLKSNANINIKSVYNEALSYAAAYEDPEVIALLLKRGADVNAKGDENGWTPLICAARYDNTKAIAFLLKNGADTQARDDDGKRAIDYARENYNPKDTKVFDQLYEASKITIKR
ncbi:hypothetical protein FACS1894187_25300 [Synergistales bacterium]|nr:hypothetical protein FACS1894187_25300 [Synergistales bacterium]